METHSVAVIICAHTIERLDDIRAAVASVQSQTRQPDEVVLVIDHNPVLLDAVGDLGPTVVASAGPKGLSGARNTGTEAARSEIVAYLDDDAVADPAWLETLIAPFEDPAVVAVGGRATPKWDREAPDWFPAEYNWVVGCSHRGLPERRAEVRNVIGCNMAFRRSSIIDLGGFDTGLGRDAVRPLGCEETELCIRLRQADDRAKVILEPAAEIHHRVPDTRTTWRYFFRRCRAEGNSKAYVVSLVGSEDGLQSERSYVTSVLPRAFARAATGLPAAPLRSSKMMAALAGGLAVTAGGYAEMKIKAGRA
jgi:GT2 family glycosyltransferase